MQYVWSFAQIDAPGSAAEGRRVHMQMQLLRALFYLQLHECSNHSSRVSLLRQTVVLDILILSLQFLNWLREIELCVISLHYVHQLNQRSNHNLILFPNCVSQPLFVRRKVIKT